MNSTDNISFKDDFMRFFSLAHADISDLDMSYDCDGGLIVRVKLNSVPHECPVCGTVTSKIKDYSTRHINHALFSNRRCIIEYRARRYICPECGKSFYERDPFSYPQSRYSFITVSSVLKELKSVNATFTSVARQFSLSPSTVISIFDRNIHIPRKTLPRYLCIDEVYAFHSEASRSQYVCVLLDYDTGRIIDLLPSRYKKDLVNYFHAIPRSEREKVEAVSIDMWATYNDVSRLFFPNADVQVDRFHVEQQFMKELQNVRIREMNAISRRINELETERKVIKNRSRYEDLPIESLYELDELRIAYYIFKKFNWLLNKHGDYPPLDSNRKKKFNRRIGRYMNYHDLLWTMLAASDDLIDTYSYYEELHKFYESCSYDDAPAAVTELIREARCSTVPELNRFANTLTNWKQQIISSMKRVDFPSRIDTRKIRNKEEIAPRHISNGIIENRNREIKKLKDTSCGYTNWERFRNRVLYCLNDELPAINLNSENNKKP